MWRSIGGLIGLLRSGTITDTYATGNVTATATSEYVGGLIGIDANTAGSASIYNSYASGNVSGGSQVGGLSGLGGRL